MHIDGESSLMLNVEFGYRYAMNAAFLLNISKKERMWGIRLVYRKTECYDRTSVGSHTDAGDVGSGVKGESS